MENKIEYRVIDLDMFDGEMSEVLNSMGEKGWEVVKIFEPMKYTNSDGMFVRVIFKRFRPLNDLDHQRNLFDILNNTNLNK